MWCNIEDLNNITYKDSYNEFIDCLYYATDRMSINRWLYLQIYINRTNDLVYDLWEKEYYWHDWTKEIENGWSDTKSCTTKLQEDCANEFKTIIKPLIIENQKIRKENENQK